MSTIFFFCPNLIFWKFFLPQHSNCWILFYFQLHLVFFLMQNLPVTREWYEADWLDPLLILWVGDPYIHDIQDTVIPNRKTWGGEILRENPPPPPCVTCHVSHVMFHMSCVTCHVSYFMCHISCVTCHVSQVICHMSCVTCHASNVRYQVSSVSFYIQKIELFGGGSVIKGAYPI